MRRCLLLLAFLLYGALARAEPMDTYRFDSVGQEQQYRQLTESLRCPKCQNNSIADSNSMIAADMRLKVYQLLRQGQSPEQITAWMVSRYGNFVSYRPPVTPSTLILWIGPALFVLCGALVILRRGSKRVRREREVHAATSLLMRQRRVPQDTPGAASQRSADGAVPEPTDQRGVAAVPRQGEPVAVRPSASRWLLLPGVLLLTLVSVGLYLKSGGLAQVMAWRQAESALPVLRAQLLDPQAPPLNAEQLTRLAQGLRAALQRDPHSLDDWLMLGRLGRVLNNAALAGQAFEQALRLAPDDPQAILSYAGLLTSSADPQDNRRAAAMLQAMAQRDGGNLRLLALLAFNAFAQQDYAAAIAAWDKMLTLLPDGDSRVAPVRRSIQLARSLSGRENARLTVTIRLSPEAEKMLPREGVLYISVSDGNTPVPVAVKKLPLSHFPLSLTLDDSNAMMPDRLLTSLPQVQVRAQVSRDGGVTPRPGDWYGLSEVVPFNGQQQLTVEIDRRVAGDNP